MPQFTQIELARYLTEHDGHSRECPFITRRVRDLALCTCFYVYTQPASLYGYVG